MTKTSPTATYDVMIVGSGPAGATFAREYFDLDSQARILMVEAGPALTARPGESVLNLVLEERGTAQRLAQGSDRERPTSGTGIVDGAIAARPGTFLLRQTSADVDRQRDMPAAAMSSNVGGMGAHWTCACPEPAGKERIPFIPRELFDDGFSRARELLSVTQHGFPANPLSTRIRKIVGKVQTGIGATDRPVQSMPLACVPREGRTPLWSGVAELLEPMLNDKSRRFTLRSETMCRRLIHEDGRVTSAELLDLATGSVEIVPVSAAVVACDALRSPQLLWNSGIRPSALGRYLNDQPQIVAAVDLRSDIYREFTDASSENASVDIRDHFTGVTWVPYQDGSHPYHGQILQLDAAPILVGDVMTKAAGVVVMLSWFASKEVRSGDRIVFDVAHSDAQGMPSMSIDYQLTDADERNIQAGIEHVTRVGQSLGTFVANSHPRLLPAGSSLHYQGTVRMGAIDDGTSVCDPTGRVWDFANLFVAGNGVIPTPTACNPTATASALAVISARHLAAQKTLKV